MNGFDIDRRRFLSAAAAAAGVALAPGVTLYGVGASAREPDGGRAWRIGPLVLRLLPPGHPSGDLEKLVAIIGAVCLAGLLVLPLDLLAPFAGSCRLKSFTGFPCLSCGLTRAVLALGDGRVLEAIRMNPLFVGAGLGLLAWTPVSWALWLARLRRPRLGFAGRRARLVLGLLLLAAVAANWAFLVLDGR